MIKKTLILLVIALFTLNSGAQMKQVIDSIKKIYAPDKRVALWEIKTTNDDGIAKITGKVDNQQAKDELVAALKRNNIYFIDNINVLPASNLENKWGLVKIAYAHLRSLPGHEYELMTQALMGTPIRILEEQNGWYRVQTPDNYISWIINNSVQLKNEIGIKNWKCAERYVVTAVSTYLYSNTKCTEIASDLILGNILEYKGTEGNLIKLITPDGRIGYAKRNEVKEINEWANQKFDANIIIKVAKMLMGSTYTWGGTSTKGVDCSGLTKTCYFANGIILQRDASQQVLYGTKMAPKDWEKAIKGDLLYFGTKKGKVTHTAIYIGNGAYIHASGMVKINSIDPKAKNYLTTPFLSINRINGKIDNAGIQSVKNHHWYFNK